MKSLIESFNDFLQLLPSPRLLLLYSSYRTAAAAAAAALFEDCVRKDTIILLSSVF